MAKTPPKRTSKRRHSAKAALSRINKTTPLKRSAARTSVSTPASSIAESSSSPITRAQKKAQQPKPPSHRKLAALDGLLKDAESLFRASNKHSFSIKAPHVSTAQANVLMKSADDVTWIMISNVHARVATEDIVQVLFGDIGKLRSLKIHRDANGDCQGNIDVAFERKEDADAAVSIYDDNIEFFGMSWKIQQFGKRRCTRSYDTDASSTSLHSYSLRSRKLALSTAQSSSGVFPALKRVQRLEAPAVEIGVTERVFISNINPQVPTEIIQVLFQKEGPLSYHHVHYNAKSTKQGTALIVYERREDAVAAVKLYKNNIRFFHNTWGVVLDVTPIATSKSDRKGKSRLST